jgi:hypothetical protein
MPTAQLSVLGWNAALDGVLATLDGGTMKVLSLDETVLADLPFGEKAFAPAKDGTATMLPMRSVQATGIGKAVMFRCFTKAGEQIYQGVCSGPTNPTDDVQPDPDLRLNDADIRVGGLVGILGWTFSAPN